MKFLCDRCKTRYSIGDDRVRGKILKIRCKNCGNVITVREGMVPEPDAVPPPEYAGRTKPTTTTSPAAHEERAAEAATVPARPGANASNAVGRAKQPVAAKPAAKEPASTGSVAQKLPRGEATFGQPEGRTPGGRRAPQDNQRGEPINALNAAFASAMAKPPPALEEEWYVSIDGVQAGPFSLAEAQRWVGQKPFDAELHCWSEGFDDWLPVDKVSHFRGLRKRPVPAVAPPPLPRAAGSPRPVIAAQQAAAPAALPIEDQSKPLFAATMATLERAAPAVSSPGIQLPPAGALAPPSARATPAHGVRAGNGVNGAARVEDSLQPEPRLMPRPDARPDAWSAPQPAAERAAPPYSDPFAQIDRAESRPVAAQGTNSSPATDFDSGDGELHIGEVSRVVNLADLVRPPRPNPAPVRRAPTAAAARLTNANPALRATSSVASLPGTGSVASIDGAPPIAAEGDPALTMAPDAKSHRRGLIALLSVAIVLVLGGAAAVILFVNTDTLTGGRLGQVHDIDTSRPDDPAHHTLPGTTAPVPPTNPFIPRPVPRPRPITPVEPGHDPDPPPGGSLRGEEIEDMARKHQDMTQRCYMRSQRGADSIIVGDVKKITVTLTIDRDGSVTDVGLSEHAADNLGKCLISSMKTWKFRVSAGGAFRISLNFVSG